LKQDQHRAAIKPSTGLTTYFMSERNVRDSTTTPLHSESRQGCVKGCGQWTLDNETPTDSWNAWTRQSTISKSHYVT